MKCETDAAKDTLIKENKHCNIWLKRMQKCLDDCPPGHWLFAADGGLYLMRYNTDGVRVKTADGNMDQRAIIGRKLTGPTIDGGFNCL